MSNAAGERNAAGSAMPPGTDPSGAVGGKLDDCGKSKTLRRGEILSRPTLAGEGGVAGNAAPTGAMAFGLADAASVVPVAARDANKYTRGKLVVAGGCAAYPAAPVMSALAAQRCGAGYVALALPSGAAAAARTHVLSITVSALPEVRGSFCAASVDGACESLTKAAAFVVGPGMGRADEAGEFLSSFLASEAACSCPGVLDADALFHIAHDRKAFLAARDGAAPLVLTPHYGEAARLLGDGHRVDEPAACAVELARKWNNVVALKGPDTYIAAPDGRLRVVTVGGPELAHAGTGDVLAGVIGALLAQGVESFDAACLGVYLHGKAGALAAAELGVSAVVPEDLPLCLARAIRSLEPLSTGLTAAQLDAERRATE